MAGCQSWGRRCNYAENRWLFVLVVWPVYRHFAVAQRTRLTSTLHRRPAPTWRLQAGSWCPTTPRTGCPNCSSRTPRRAWLSTTLWRIRGSVYVSPLIAYFSFKCRNSLEAETWLTFTWVLFTARQRTHARYCYRFLSVRLSVTLCSVSELNESTCRQTVSPSLRPSFSFWFTQPSRHCKIPITPHQGR